MVEQRPNPDELLEKVQREQEKSQRGRLKIFFGASAGVGKTFAMLSAARLLRQQSLDVVVGIVETHGRQETAALLSGLEQLPLRDIEYRGKTFKEFDLDGVLKRKPALVLVDELAHSNIPGSRHPKRWQDIEELLSVGIDVLTTVNVQHLESLNDVINQITGIPVYETVPDHMFDEADAVVVVDLTPDELLQRLKEGKVYIPQQAERAIQNFFRKGNLLALRELALRRTADRVDEEMLAYRQQTAGEPVWQTRESILVCIGPGPGAEKIIRNGSRVASYRNAPWHAVYIETPRLQRLSKQAREQTLKALKLAEDLGAATASLSGPDPAVSLVEYARRHNLTKVVIGRDRLRSWTPWHRSFAERLGRLAPDLDIIQVARETNGAAGTLSQAPAEGRDVSPRARLPGWWYPYLWATVGCVATALIATALPPYFDLPNIVMLFLLTVVLVAVKWGRGPAVFASFVSVAAFDFFFVPPQFSFAVSDVQYLLTFVVMLTVALTIGHLTAGLSYQARVASLREERSRALYEMARELSGTLVLDQIAEVSDRYVRGVFQATAALLLPDLNDKLRSPGSAQGAPEVDLAIAQWVFDRGEPAGLGTDTLPRGTVLYLPLKAPMRNRGVLAVAPRDAHWLLIPEQRRLLDTFAALIAIALERVHYVEVAQIALVRIESERLRNSVLSALSHDLRTPLTVLVGLADSLTLTKPALSGTQLDLASAIRDQAFRMSALVNNLLDMARLQAGEVKLNRQWQPLEEVIGSALKTLERQLFGHRVQVTLPRDLPLLEFDAVLIERVFCNLLENAVKYTPPGSEIRIEAGIEGSEAYVSVADNGPGLPPKSEEVIFEKFMRGDRESATPGVGLGLAICRAIVEAHKGRIWAENVPAGGARFVFTLPLGTPPTLVAAPEDADSEA